VVLDELTAATWVQVGMQTTGDRLVAVAREMGLLVAKYLHARTGIRG
jgi:hypothetical protein